MGVAPVPTIKKAQKTRRPARRTFTRALPHLVPCLVYFLYLVLGSWMFIYLEGGTSEYERYMALVRVMRATLEEAIHNASMGISARTDLGELLDNYTELVARSEWKHGRYDNLQYGGRWTFSSSMLFCIITITTIGYGDIVPVTLHGKVFLSVYAAFGIPINVIFLADVGYLLAKLIVKIIRAIKLYKISRRKSKELAKELKLGNVKPSSRFRRRRKVAKRGKKFKHRQRPKPKGGLSASRGMSVHSRAVMRPNVSDNEKVNDTTFNELHKSPTPNSGGDLCNIQTDVKGHTYLKANKSGEGKRNKGFKHKSGGLMASRNMSVHARSLRRRAPANHDDTHVRDHRGRHGSEIKRKGGGISASQHMSVHSRSIMRHRPEDLDSDDNTSNNQSIKRVSDGLAYITKEILPNDNILTLPNSKSDADLVGNEQLSNFDNANTLSNVENETLSVTLENTDNESVDTEVPTIIVLMILIAYICIGAVMLQYVEGWTYGQSLYFTIVTLTTIGYGDMAPNMHYNNDAFFTFIIYTVLGLAIMSTCIALVQAKVLRAIDKVTRKIRKHAEL